MIIKGHKSVVNLQKPMYNKPNQDRTNINAYAKFGLIPSICSQDTECKQNFEENQGP